MECAACQHAGHCIPLLQAGTSVNVFYSFLPEKQSNRSSYGIYTEISKQKYRNGKFQDHIFALSKFMIDKKGFATFSKAKFVEHLHNKCLYRVGTKMSVWAETDMF